MLLDRADRDVYNARLLISPTGNPDNDELIDDIAAYHVQQGIEKALKYALFSIGGLDETSRTYRTHSIPTLIDLVQENCGFTVPERLILASNDITGWEANSRYGEDPVAMRDEIMEAIEMYEELKQLILEKQKQTGKP